MDFRDWFMLEMRGQYNANNTIVVDVQPFYANYISFDIKEFANFLTQMCAKGRKVLYFYNGSDLGIQDNDNSIKEWLASALVGNMYAYESYDDEYGDEDDSYTQYEEAIQALSSITFYDKGYGFFRDWMDQNVDDHVIVQTIRAMAMHNCNSGDLPEEVLDELGGGDDLNQHGEIYLPQFDLRQLRSFNNAFICGGGKNECLREVQLLFNAFNIKYRVFSQFVF